MKRATQERQRTISVWRRHLRIHGENVALCMCEFQLGRFRKGQRVGGCGNSRCYLCHSEKLFGVPNRPGRRSEVSWKEWCSELQVHENAQQSVQCP